MKWIFRIALGVIVVLAALNGLHRATAAYQRHKQDEQVRKAQPNPDLTEAMASYLSFYWGNAVLIPGICQEQGIDLSAYGKQFVERNAIDHEKVRKQYEQRVGNEQALVIYFASDARLRKGFTSLLESIGKSNDGSTATDGCRAIAANPQEALRRMNFRTVQSGNAATLGI